MDTASTLAFFQNFYADTSLYVVPEPASAAVTPVPAEVPPPAAAEAPAATPVTAAVPVATAPAQPPAVPPMPSISAPHPAPLVVPVAAVAAIPPVPMPTATPVAPPAATAPVVPEVPATAPRQPGQATVAELPAAAPAPAGRVQPTPTQSPVAHIPFSTLGSNPNGLIVLVRLTPEEFRKLPRNVFLNNLLKAIRLIMEDVVLVNVEHPSYPVALCTLRQTMAARQFLAFGKNLLDVAVYTTQPYEPVLLFGDTAFLGAGEISMLEYDAGRKKQLWQAIQRMFMS
ncbi:hypothetical protein [Hymenobacter weizhouensis]|uniref:hypothetical protein n=1 Tax=Hymenobacter sp. YIM 151500-1 TaxID=2987689 RepID=UPI0022262CB2|nr:hypothetical protein [Hymenobacter sp. YIM 151500-1]UYZ64020.1 hypothetical protein OIS53_04035 [Hymenobacter sp. YIM 151500-1]